MTQDTSRRLRIGIDWGGTKMEAIALAADGTERFRQRHWTLHLMGYMPDGVTKRNLTPPTHVPWTGGVMGTATTYPRVTWTTDLEGAMTSSTGEGLVPWRAWESREQNLKRGVRAEDIPS